MKLENAKECWERALTHFRNFVPIRTAIFIHTQKNSLQNIKKSSHPPKFSPGHSPVQSFYERENLHKILCSYNTFYNYEVMIKFLFTISRCISECIQFSGGWTCIKKFVLWVKLIYDNCFRMWSELIFFRWLGGGSLWVIFNFRLKSCFHSLSFPVSPLCNRHEATFFDNYEIDFMRQCKICLLKLQLKFNYSVCC